MKRLCFDTESDLFIHGIGLLNIEYVRDQFSELNYSGGKFHCAIVYDEDQDRHFSFDSSEADALVEKLSEAEELISHSGSRTDFLLLQKLYGRERIAHLFDVPHFDLFYKCQASSLDQLASRYIPDLLPAMKSSWEARKEEANQRWPATKWGSGELRPPEHFIDWKLAKARFDVDRTYAIYKRLVQHQ